MKIAKNILELVGKTPLVAVNNIDKGGAEIFAKLEYFNPTGSVKDRTALAMVNDAMARGVLKEGGTIIEPTSGNTGIGLALVASVKKFRLILTMPDTMSLERRKMLASMGAELVLTDGTLGMNGAIAKALELQKEIPNSFIPQQFENPANPQIHVQTTAKEIWEDTDGKVDIVVACVGTGGTACGIAEGLKNYNKQIQVFAVEPKSSAVLSGEKAGVHKIQGIGAGFIPKIYNANIIDGVVAVADEDAGAMTRKLLKEEGIFAGISSGAAMFAAVEISKKPENAGKKIVVILPDTGMRYLSTDWLFN